LRVQILRTMAAVEASASQEQRVEKLQAGVDTPASADPEARAKALLEEAVAFLRNPAVAKHAMSAKVQYLHQKLRLGSAGVKLAVQIVYGGKPCPCSLLCGPTTGSRSLPP
jgi:hypothetical protein